MNAPRHAVGWAGVTGAWRWFGALLWLTVALAPALAEPRFPPPDFETSYVLPTTQHAAARSIGLVYLDVAVLLGALGLASWLVLRQRSRRAVMGLSIFSLLYFGFYREGCICAIGSVQNVTLALFDTTYAVPLMVLLFFVAPLVTALFFGRTFCAAVCPHGALQDLVLIKPITLPRWVEEGLSVVPYLYLGVGVWFAATGSAFIICRYDPFVPIFRLSGSFSLLLLGAAFLLVGMFIGRPYCRFLCPYGALLKLAAKVARWKVRITPDLCTQCRLCEQSCPFGAIREPTPPEMSTRELAAERRRFLGLVALVPALVVLGGWVGSTFGAATATIDRDVHLADLYLRQQTATNPAALSTVDALAYARAQRSADTLLPEAVAVRRQFVLGGWLFGGFAGLVIGLKLARFSLRPQRRDFEPDRGACVACARCFADCPQERVRLGLWPAGTPVPTAATAAAQGPAASS